MRLNYNAIPYILIFIFITGLTFIVITQSNNIMSDIRNRCEAQGGISIEAHGASLQDNGLICIDRSVVIPIE